MALKANQSDPEVYFCLAQYYLLVAKDITRGVKCLDKALLLKPDFTEASLLQYNSLIE